MQGLVVAGLVYLRCSRKENWSSPWTTPLICCAVSLTAYSFIIIVPWIPPPPGYDPGYLYFLFPLVAISVLSMGAVYWVWLTKILAKIKGYKIVAERVVDDTGDEIVVYKKVPVNG
jgi:hypothetical protein